MAYNTHKTRTQAEFTNSELAIGAWRLAIYDFGLNFRLPMDSSLTVYDSGTVVQCIGCNIFFESHVPRTGGAVQHYT
eukprot:1189956-Prorocentrum_minimum.AAC.3